MLKFDPKENIRLHIIRAGGSPVNRVLASSSIANTKTSQKFDYFPSSFGLMLNVIPQPLLSGLEDSISGFFIKPYIS
jgi:hypothetical protein